MSINVLFTSVGRRVELLRSFRRAYQTLGLSGKIVAVDMDPLAPALPEADVTYMAPRLDHSEYIPTLKEILRREQIAIVFPLIDPDIPVLAEHRATLEATGARLAVVSEQAAAIAADKWRTYEFFAEAGIPTPRSWLPDQLDSTDAEFPLFIKPRFGSASQHTFKVNDRRQFEFFSGYVPDAIVQEFLPGAEITNDVICDTHGKVLSVVSRERIRVRAGEVIVGKTVFDRAIAEVCVKIAEALPACGPITVQCMIGAQGPKFTEINARLGGGLPLGIAAGADSPAWLLATAAEIPIEIPPLGSYRQNVYLSRFDDSLFMTETERETMASRRL